jgi:hypothetical protein
MATNALRTYVARSGTSATNTTAVSLTAATAKSVVSVLGAATDSLALIRVKISFASATATDAPAIVEVGITTALGTVTSFTPVQWSGTSLASTASAGYNATVEPTYSRIIDSFYVPVYMGSYAEWVPLGFEPQVAASNGFAIRVTSPAASSCLASVLYGE